MARRSDSQPRGVWRARHLGPGLTAAALLLAPSAAPAQIIPGIDTVKVKTIPIAPTGKPMAAPIHAPGTAATPPASPVGLPAAVRVRTLRISPKGHIVRDVSGRDVPGYESLPRQ